MYNKEFSNQQTKCNKFLENTIVYCIQLRENEIDSCLIIY